jgi:hypothetical protein
LNSSTPVSGLSFWRESIVAEQVRVEAVSLVGSDQWAWGVSADAAARPKIAAILKSDCADLFPDLWVRRG